MKLRAASVLGSALVSVVVACGGKLAEPSDFAAPVDPPALADAGSPPVRPDAAPPTPTAVIDWQPCSDPYTGDCATVELPVDRNAPTGDTLGIFVTRFTNPANARGALWLLQGGPGGSISAFEYALDAYRELYPDLTIYGMEHRGVSRSSRLSCEDDYCANQADLGFYTTTAAAADLHALVGLTRKVAQPTFVYGVSYGTYVAQRYLTMFPAEPAAVVLDSVVPLDGLYFSDADREGEYPLTYWATLCEEDAFCNSKLPAPTLATLRSTLASIEQGHCPASTLDKSTSTLFRQAMLYNELGWTLMPILYRFQRCQGDDAQVIASYFSQLQQIFPPQQEPSAGPADEEQNLATYLNVAFSELWEQPAPPQDELQSRYQTALLPSGGIQDLGLVRESWPVYPQDEFVGVYPKSSVPVLILNGTLDSQTPLDLVRGVETHYVAPHQAFVVVPNANHGTAVSFGNAEVPCGSLVMRGFLADPEAPLDTSCTASPEPISFEGDPDFTPFLFGTSDAWEGSLGPQPLRTPSPALTAKLEQIAARRRLLGR